MKKKLIVALFVTLAAGTGIYLWQADSGGEDASGTSIFHSAPPIAPAVAPQAETLHNTFQMKPPAGAKVAIYEFDDLECPFCSRAVPILHAAAERYRIPLVHHDYPLWEIHNWSLDAAVTARYLEDKVSPAVADQFRRDLFAHQTDISSKDDLDRFTRNWFKSNGQGLPFVLDANGDCRREVQADRALGDSMGIHSTPCIFVVTGQKQVYVANLDELSQIIDRALAETETASTEPLKGIRRDG